jgi:hypothetical protein
MRIKKSNFRRKSCGIFSCFVFILHIESKYDLPGITELKIPENVSLTFGQVLSFLPEAVRRVNNNTKES